MILTLRSNTWMTAWSRHATRTREGYTCQVCSLHTVQIIQLDNGETYIVDADPERAQMRWNRPVPGRLCGTRTFSARQFPDMDTARFALWMDCVPPHLTLEELSCPT